ncbi:TIGR01212 family radical SAM protein [Bacteroidales bacterium OttesenSCG-928-K03]|nr:TIGR01212 family radical SAM protein [Bacteroidales bacterium OttesenSCG-928-L14]MDL2242795.1 TIGR01212 family radical SAM protein [Bacteroidales bacterium OttesenSCG-928-K03]
MSKRYNSYPEYFRSIFGERVQKLSINAGFTCPNRDGTCGIGGCTFCNALAFNPSYCDTNKSVTQQMIEGQIFHQTRYRRATKYLAYFQTFSNTHANVDTLEKLYKEALDFPNTIGIVIGTRPDCINKPKLDLLESLAEKYYVKLEFGIESTYDSTLNRINRGHNFKTTVDAINATAERKNIHIGGHLIFGLPGESKEMILDQAKIISELPLETIKFHQLQIMKETLMAVDYLKNPDEYYFYELNEYIDLVIKFIELLNPSIVIERIASEVPPRFLLLPPKWDIRYDEVLRLFEKKLEEYDTWQGRDVTGDGVTGDG